MRLQRPVIDAILAWQQGAPARAIELLEPVRRYEHAPTGKFWARYVRGQAHLAMKNGAAAAEAFESILTRRGEVPTSMLYPLSYIGLARAKGKGDVEEARKAYAAFFDLWRDADQNLSPLVAARAEMTSLP
jgi:eukaryotic-like serine/threonine-protein kinase